MNDIEKFVEYIIDANTSFEDIDRMYLTNRIKALIGDTTDSDSKTVDILKLRCALVQTAVDNGNIQDIPTEREIMADRLMDLATPIPSTINEIFWNLYSKSPETATNYFYKLCLSNDYIKSDAIAKNISYDSKTDYGDLEITINLSKPEKDPKAIAAAKNIKQTGYPKCQLCLENEGYAGRLDYPPRANLRIISFPIGSGKWGFQYSPYAYFSEHAIFIDEHHVPMVINKQTFSNLLNIVTLFPQYFVGSNADLPIVGGSMLSHEHYQGGRHIFPMMKAPVIKAIDINIPDVSAGIVKWPLSTIRLESTDASKLVIAGNKIFEAWKDYSDESVDVRAYTGDERHHTVTPIAYKQNDKYILDIVLRDNQTSDKYPDGIFHPHQDVQHIKKENIGLIEVMGRAILPARLKTELAEVEKYLLDQPNEMEDYHKAWADSLKTDNQLNSENVHELVDQAVGQVFARVLEDAGVFKEDDAGQKAFAKFTELLKGD